jgi:hypothetical protein
VGGHGTVSVLLDQLIDCWSSWESYESFYLDELAPAIVTGKRDRLTGPELEAITALKAALSVDEWQRLPELLRQRLSDREAERLLAQARERERRVRERAERDAARQAEDVRRAEYAVVRRVEEARRAELEMARRAEQERRAEEERAHEAAHQRPVVEERQAAEQLRQRVQALRGRIHRMFETEFLSADEALEAEEDAELISEPEYRASKTAFVRDWAERELDQHLDDEQASAVGTFGGDVRVIARAGSGKTRTLVTRAIFLIEHCGVSPRSVLLLAFNRSAADEMRDRLSDALGGQLPHVMTFHALAYALVHPEETLVFDDMGSDSFGLSRAIQNVIDEHVRSDEYADAIRAVMLEHFRGDWERLVEGGYQLW